MTADGLFAPEPDEPVVTTVEEIENLCRIAAEAAVTEALDRLRALPLAERMDAMGMKPFQGTQVPNVYVARQGDEK